MIKSFSFKRVKRVIALSLAMVMCFVCPVSASELSLTDGLTSLFMSGNRSYEGEVTISFNDKAIAEVVAGIVGCDVSELESLDVVANTDLDAIYDKDKSETSLKGLITSIAYNEQNLTELDYENIKLTVEMLDMEVLSVYEVIRAFPYKAVNVKYNVASYLPKDLNTEVNATVTFVGKEYGDTLTIPVHFIVDKSGLLLSTSTLFGSYDLVTKLVSIYDPSAIDFPVLESKNLLIERMGNIEYFAYPFVDEDITLGVDSGLDYVVEQSKLGTKFVSELSDAYKGFDTSDYIKESASGVSYSLDMEECEDFVVDAMTYTLKNVSTIVPAVYNAWLNYTVDSELLEDTFFNIPMNETDCVQIAPEYLEEGDVAPDNCLPYIPPTREELIERYSISENELKAAEYCTQGFLGFVLSVVENNDNYYTSALKDITSKVTYSEDCPARTALEMLEDMNAETVDYASSIYALSSKWLKGNFGHSYIRESVDVNILKGTFGQEEELKIVYDNAVVPVHIVSKITSKPLVDSAIKVNFNDVTSMHIEDISELWEYVENTVNPVTDVNIHYSTDSVGLSPVYFEDADGNYVTSFSGYMNMTPISVERHATHYDSTSAFFMVIDGVSYIDFDVANSLLRLDLQSDIDDEGNYIAIVNPENTTYGDIPAFDLYTFVDVTDWDDSEILMLKVRDVEKFGYKVDYNYLGNIDGLCGKLSELVGSTVSYPSYIVTPATFHNIRIYR